MLSLFWKIFLSFWLSLFIFMLAGTWLGESLHHDNKVVDLNPHQMEFVHEVFNRVSHIPLHRLARLLKTVKHRPPIKKLWLKDATGEWLNSEVIPNALAYLHQTAELDGPSKVRVLRSDNSLWFGPLVLDVKEGKFLLYVQTEVIKPLDTRTILDHPLFRLLLLILASGAAAAITTRLITKPVKMLQKTVQIVADDLSIRVEPQLLKRKDELGNLARQIEEMIKTIEKLINSQQQILWDVSHELRSPLARIQTTLAIAEQQKSPEKAFQRLNNEVVHLNNMISQLLLLGRINSEIKPIHKQSISLLELITQICEDMKLEKNQCPEFEILIDEQVDIQGDPMLLTSAFGNLLRNARDHNDKQVFIRIEAEVFGQQLIIQFSDNGVGVSPARIQEIFEPFKRGTTSTHGLGLGLTIVKNIVEQHQGSIDVEPATPAEPENIALPQGLKFILRFPLS